MSVAAERDSAVEKLAHLERRLDAEKLAAMMHHKGLETDTDFASLADHLEKEAERGKFEVIKQAVEMVGPNMGFKTASVHHDSVTQGAGHTDFERFLVGDVG
jgi:hypothetical protein